MPLLPGRCPCASITSENVIAYLGNRKVFLKSYSAPAAGTKEIILSRWRNRFPKSCWSICGCIIPRCCPAIQMCWPRRRFPKSPATAKLSFTTDAAKGTSSLSGKTMSTTFRRSIWWSFSALPTFAPSPANRRGTSAPCKAFQAGGKSVTCTRQRWKEVRSNDKFLRRTVFRKP